MNSNNVARPRKLDPTELAKLLTASHTQIYDLTAVNAVPTAAKVTAEKRARQRYYLLSVEM